MTTEEKTRWIENHGSGFGVVREQDDFLHLHDNPPGASVTETYYFGFHVAEQAIHGYVYVWFHPNLKVVTAGCLISKGMRPSTMAADYMDIRAYLAMDDHVDHETGIMHFPMGLELRPIEPMKSWQLTLADSGNGTSFNLRFSAAQEAVVRADQKHFDQNMHVQGDLCLRGQEHRVDCYQIRDRSWQNLRPEDPMPVPPYDWLTLTQGAGFAMNLSLFDDLQVLGNPQNRLHVPPVLLQDGWVHINGELRRIVQVDKRTERQAHNLSPIRHCVEAVDDKGDVYELVGESVGGCNWNGWPNMIWHQNLMRWTCNGQQAWGESQEVHWHELVHLLHRA
ncbi:DUF7064 domain-containing protein [Pseudomonas umsongensis]|uniref:DUF7064 domain-containing protein n=1 Tax=Pseudomonas umsongensis TaxID=198618 RepID=UPI00200B2884|nr:hypothetical protein [Pseudomonas umsongensis]MCK8683339.1 hypothetical protein [Pseudomonas umsongensis]